MSPHASFAVLKRSGKESEANLLRIGGNLTDAGGNRGASNHE